MNQQQDITGGDPAKRASAEATLARHGKKEPKPRGGVGLPVVKFMAFRDFETRKINLEVLVDDEWANQIAGRLASQDDKIVDGAIGAIEKQAENLGGMFFEALIHAIQIGRFDATLVLKVEGYEKP